MDEKTPIIIDSSNTDLTNRINNVKRDLPKYWNKEYINHNLNKIKNNKHRMLFKTMWMSGARVSEIIAIRKQDIDFENYTAKLRWLKSRKYNYRNIPLHPRLRDILQVYTAAMNSADKLFPLSRQRVWQLAKKYFKGHPHQFRHSFAVNWLRGGGDIIILHRILGHSKVQTTMEYLKIVPTDQGKELLKVEFD